MVSVIDIIVCIVYFVIVIGVGIFASRKAKSKEDFLVAGRSLPLPMFTAAMAAVVIGGGCTIGGTTLAYNSGIGGIWVGGMYAISIFLLAWLLRTKMSNMRILSTNEGVGIFYGPYARSVSALIMLIYLFMIAVLNVVSIGAVLSIMTGLSTTVSMLIGGGIIVAYITVGGMYAVAFTDIIQFVVMTIGVMFILPILGLMNVGGFSGLSASLPPESFDLTSIGGSRIIAYVFLLVPGFLVGQDIWQKAFTAKSPQVAKKGTLLASGYIFLYAIATVIIGMCVAAAIPNLENSDLAFATAAATFCPGGVRGLVLAAALASIMSTANGGIIGSATVIFNDMISVKKPEISGKAAINTTRVLIVLVCICAVVCAIFIQSVLVALDVAYAYLSGCVFVPLVLAFLLKRVSAKAGLISLVASFITVTVLFFICGITSTYPIIFGMIVSVVLFFVVNAIDKKGKHAIDFAEDGEIFIDGKKSKA
ncbi:MAG: sodium:solute symporter [Clostridiales bacterium]|nr:sodium:solute symporter [Clostridiales bacterium]